MCSNFHPPASESLQDKMQLEQEFRCLSSQKWRVSSETLVIWDATNIGVFNHSVGHWGFISPFAEVVPPPVAFLLKQLLYWWLVIKGYFKDIEVVGSLLCDMVSFSKTRKKNDQEDQGWQWIIQILWTIYLLVKLTALQVSENTCRWFSPFNDFI